MSKDDQIFKRAMQGLGIAKDGLVDLEDDELFRKTVDEPIEPDMEPSLKPPETETIAKKSSHDLPKETVAGDAIFLEAMEEFEPSLPDVKAKPRRAAKDPTIGTPKALHRRIRRGKIRPERTLDLHGFTKAKALSELTDFLRLAQRDRVRVVTVICGRGLHSKDEAVLLTALQQWLHHDISEYLDNALPAPANMGGQGCWYLFLRMMTP